MIKVYRVEHEIYQNEKVYAGPYSPSGINIADDWADPENSGHGDPNHPSPYKDTILKEHPLVMDFTFSNTYVFGFNSLDQLKQWFSETEITRLRNLQYVVAEYVSEDIIVGDKQILFVPKQDIERKLIYSI